MKKLNKGGVIASIISAFVLLSQIFGLSIDEGIVDKIITAITGVLVIFGIISNNNLGSGSTGEKLIEEIKKLISSGVEKTENENAEEKSEAEEIAANPVEKCANKEEKSTENTISQSENSNITT